MRVREINDGTGDFVYEIRIPLSWIMKHLQSQRGKDRRHFSDGLERAFRTRLKDVMKLEIKSWATWEDE